MSPESIIERLQLQPHPVEGGFFRETYRSSGNIGDRSISTAIYYMLTLRTVSALHRLPGDEVFHFYMGDPVQMLQLWPDGSSRIVTLGTNLELGQVPQLVVPGGVWQGSVLVDGGSFALLGATMAPGFDYADYESGQRDALTWQWPGHTQLIERLTP